MLVQSAGILQAAFYMYSMQGSSSYDTILRLNVTQFRNLMTAAKVPVAAFTTDKIDDIFTQMATTSRVSKIYGSDGI